MKSMKTLLYIEGFNLHTHLEATLQSTTYADKQLKPTSYQC